MAITTAGSVYYSEFGSGTSATISSVAAPTGSNRLIDVGIGIEDSPAQDPSTVKLGGVSLTKAVSQLGTYSGGKPCASLWYLLESDIASVSFPADLVITWSATITRGAASLQAYKNVEQSAPEDTNSGEGDPSSTGTHSLSIVPSDGALITSCTADTDDVFTPETQGSNITDIHLDSTSSAIGHAYDIRSTGGSFNVTWAHTDGRYATVNASYASIDRSGSAAASAPSATGSASGDYTSPPVTGTAGATAPK